MSYLSNVSVTTKIVHLVFVDANNSNHNIIHFLK